MENLFYLVITFVVVLVIGVGLVLLLTPRSRGSNYVACGPLLTPTEAEFFLALEAAVAGNLRIFAKVGLGDLIRVIPNLDPKQRAIARNKIQSKHVDFVLCDPYSFQPVFAVELDDRSHQRADRQARDAFVDDALRSCAITMVRFRARSRYDAREIVATLKEARVPRQEK